jgi:hypothetical protein
LPYSVTSFQYDSLGRVTQVENLFYITSKTRYIYKYDSEGRLSNILTMFKRSQVADEDSLYRQKYEYDSTGNLISYSLEQYRVQGSPFTWTIMENILYRYDQNNLLSEDLIYRSDPLFDFQPVLQTRHQYIIDAFGKPLVYIEMQNESNIFFSRKKLVIFYDTMRNAIYGESYLWNGSGYDGPLYRHFTFSKTPPLEIDEIQKDDDIRLYPNPAVNYIYLEYFSAAGMPVVTIYNMMGDCMEAQQEVRGDKLKIDISRLSPGIYFAEIILEGKRSTKTFIRP